MPKFKLHFGIKVDGQFKMGEVVEEHPDLHTAHKEARAYAEDLYMQNPIRDVNDILKQENDVEEDVAFILFKLDMIRNTSYFAESVN